ncbi:MAG: hypothetical protein KC615_05925, partial [Anaerolineae bacterium]|nr:hypothetical protein [Anaerolineae bacterium]
DVEAVRQQITAMGDCPLVEGSSTLIKVHVHHFDPSVPLAYGVSQGFITDVVVENMDAMAAAGMAPDDVKDELAWGSGRAVQMEANSVHNVGVVVVVPGPGLEEVFLSLAMGPMAVVQGGQTMNPSTGDFLDVINALPNRRVIILPNNKNVVLTARDAAEMSDRVVEVVPTRSIPQGLAALLAFGDVQESSLDEIVDAMQSAAAFVITMEVTKSTRSVEKLGDISIEDGDYIVLANDKAVASSPQMTDAILSGFAALELDGRELVTVYYGEEISLQAAESLIERLQVISPKLQFEAVSGGQPLYPFLLSIE